MKKLIFIFQMLIVGFILQAQNTNLPVGAIPGIIDVSPMGAATYTIPIEVVPGTQDMQPNLSIVYNSMSGMGLLGMKWDLAGISAITRCGQTPYYDGKITAIQFSHNDRFMLDGERLISLGNNTYATETDNFTRIILNGTTDSPDHFIAYTDDGTIIEYGTTDNTKQKMDNSNTVVLSWLIYKITDFNGNYMFFSYSSNGNEKYLNEIRQFASGSSTPYAKVTFNYTSLPVDLGQNTHYIKGYAIPQTKLLTDIIVTSGTSSTRVRKYEFKYKHQESSANNERAVHLTQVILSGENENIKLNETTIAWRDQSSNQHNSGILNNTLIPNGYLVAGDFNGDGYMDVVNYDRNLAVKTWQLYLGNETGKEFTATGNEHKHYQYSNFFSADVDGDGCHELIIMEEFQNETRWNEIKILSLKDGVTMIDTSRVNYFDQIFFGDFDGDGKTDILFGMWDNILDKKYSFKMYSSNSGFTTPNLSISLQNNIKCKVRVGDFQRAGKTDIEIHLPNGDLKMYSYDGTTGQFSQINPSAPTQTANFAMTRYSGDFNGDGVTDLLTFYSNWQISFGKGDGTFTTPETVTGLNSNLSGGQYGVPANKIIIADMDGDGKDDIVQFAASGGKILFSKGVVNSLYKRKEQEFLIYLSGSLTYFIADMNNDGHLDIIAKGPTHTGSHNIYTINTNKQYDLPHSITDGMGKTIIFTYKPRYLPAKDFNVSRSTIQKYFCFLLDNLQISNGLGTSTNLFKYEYKFPAFSLWRKAFLGFKEFSSTNQTEKKKELYTYSINSTWHIIVPETQTTSYNNLISSEIAHNVSFIGFDKRYIPYPNGSVVLDHLLNTKTLITNSLNGSTGRLTESNIKKYGKVNESPSNWAHSETKTYTYETFTFSGNHKRTVPKRILTTQQFGSSGIMIADTLTYNYYDAGSNKARLQWERKGNTDRTITTTYNTYSTAGVCLSKTVSAQGCTPRTETYLLDATQRFITQITNPLNHVTKFTYDPKTGNILSETDANDLKTTYTYDSFGNLTLIEYPTGAQTQYQIQWWFSNHNPNIKYCIMDYTTGKPRLSVFYDILGREVRRRSGNSYSDTRYNAIGQIEKTSYPYENENTSDNAKIWQIYTYDVFGRKNTEKKPYTDLSFSYDNRKVTVTDHKRGGIQSHKDYDALGRITKAQDAGGEITYGYAIDMYNQRLSYRTHITAQGANTVVYTDLWGNRVSITEPNAGTIKSTYNNFNELIYQVDANDNWISYKYDKLGRITEKNTYNYYIPNQNVTYTYDFSSQNSKGIGRLHRIDINKVPSEYLYYDRKGRLESHQKVINNHTMGLSYSYYINGMLEFITSGGLDIQYKYDFDYNISEIWDCSFKPKPIYKVEKRNQYRQPTKATYGNHPINQITTSYDYNDFGLVTEILTTSGLMSDTLSIKGGTGGTIMNYVYDYDEKGLMTSRMDNTVGQIESYVYDNLDRLTQNNYQKGKKKIEQTFTYAHNGNMTKNSQVGSFHYNFQQPHAISAVSRTTKAIPNTGNEVEYNSYNQPFLIREGNYRLELSYGADQQRNMMTTKRISDNTVLKTRYYFNKYYEMEIDKIDNVTRHYYYIYGSDGVVALQVSKSLPLKNDHIPVEQYTDSLYYIHTDHLGSYCAITNAKGGKVVQRNCFDPWGDFAFKNYPLIPKEDKSEEDTVCSRNITDLTFPITTRGFTGHEHYPEFKIINMNARLYDPVIGRFFSPDNYVVDNQHTQDFNRYSYCLNNPLKYIDPTGMIVEYASGRDRWNSFWLRVFDSEYRRDFRELKKSEETYVIRYNMEGINQLTTDGNKLFINYSLTDKLKEIGNTRLSLLKHEFKHGIQFERGELGFENKDVGWGTVDRDGNYYEHRKWTPINYDIYDELRAQDAGASAPFLKGGTEVSRWLFDNINGNYQQVLEPVRLQRLLNTPRYQILPQAPLNNTNPERIKNYYQYALPYQLRLTQ